MVHCDGTQASIVASLYCEVPLTVLRASPYDLNYAEQIIAKVSATNANGEGPVSDPAGVATIQTEPTSMSPPTRGAGTSEGQIQVLWTALVSPVDVGGAAVTSYNLQWDEGSAESSWSNLVGFTSSYPATEYIATTGVVPGTEYAFRVRAYNAHGWGAASTTTKIAASAAPDQMAATTTAVRDLVNIRVGWVAADANSDPLAAYEVLILTGDGVTFAEDTTTCDGSSTGPLTNNYCDIPMATLRAPPFNLAQGAAVIARIRAQNSIGWGATSYDTETAGAAVLEDVPHQLPAPSRGAATSVSQVEAEWAALVGEQTGGNAIESYQLQWDAGSTGAAWYDLQGGPTAAEYSLLTSHSVSTGVSAGETYWLRVRARN